MDELERRDACSALTGVAIEPDRDRLPSGMVEATTEFDWTELPADLQADLREWCIRFSEWAGRQ